MDFLIQTAECLLIKNKVYNFYFFYFNSRLFFFSQIHFNEKKLNMIHCILSFTVRVFTIPQLIFLQ